MIVTGQSGPSLTLGDRGSKPRPLKRAHPLRVRANFWLCCFIVALTPLLAGSKSPLWTGVLLVLLAVGCASCPLSQLSRQQLWLLASVLLLCAAFATYGYIQAMPAPAWFSANPIWDRTNSLLGTAFPGRVSVRGAVPDRSLNNLLLFSLSFVSAYPLGASRTLSLSFIRWIAWVGAAYAAYGLWQEWADPSQALWGPKTAYVGSVTGPFIGRSTAAAFFGSCTIICAVLTLREVERLDLRSFRTALLVKVPTALLLQLTIHLAGVTICLAATTGTKSRAGIVIMFGAMAVALWIAGLKLLPARYKLAILLLVGPFAFGLGAGVVGTGRVGSEGFFDPYRWATYKSVITAISSSPWLGTGWGTFPDIFPSYRTAEVSLWGTWPWAHSTPLEIAMEMGIPAALLVCLAAVSLTATVISRAWLARTERRFILAAVAGVAILALLQTSIDFVLQIPHFIIIFATVAAVGLSRSLAPISKA